MSDIDKIKLIILDVDGTLTDGGIYYDSQGNEMKRFDVKDGLGIKVAIAAGIEFAIITGRTSSIVIKRARELGIKEIRDGVQRKFPAMKTLLEEKGLSMSEVGYIGDDWNDLQCMKRVGFKACPADAPEEVKEVCDFVASQAGGHGAVRDCVEDILKKRKKWQETVSGLYGCN